VEAIDYLNYFLKENEIKSKLKTVFKFQGILGVAGKPLATQI
jgi:hypothetical protein